MFVCEICVAVVVAVANCACVVDYVQLWHLTLSPDSVSGGVFLRCEWLNWPHIPLRPWPMRERGTHYSVMISLSIAHVLFPRKDLISSDIFILYLQYVVVLRLIARKQPLSSECQFVA